MQLLLIRHALPFRSEPGQGSDPELSEEGDVDGNRADAPVPTAVARPQRAGSGSGSRWRRRGGRGGKRGTA